MPDKIKPVFPGIAYYGEQMIGPTEIKQVILSCEGCDCHTQDLIKSGNEGIILYWHYCNHEKANDHLPPFNRGGPRWIGENSNTPDWCPERDKINHFTNQ